MSQKQSIYSELLANQKRELVPRFVWPAIVHDNLNNIFIIGSSSFIIFRIDLFHIFII